MAKILEIAAEQNADRIVRLTVRLGALSHMSKGHFLEHYEVAAKDTIAEGAEVETIEDPDLRSDTATDVILESVVVE